MLEPAKTEPFSVGRLLNRPLGPIAWWAIAASPFALMFWIGACFVWNHFILGPYLHDSGWYSAIVHRQGLLPKNPASAHFIRDYYGIHASVLVSAASVISYVVPLERVPYYCLFQGAIYAPLGIVVPLLWKGDRATSTVKNALLIAAASCAFALSGQVLACLGYPHFEIFVSVGLCVLLVGLARGHVPFAWMGIAIAAGTREDGGFHAAAFLAAALVCNLTGRSFPLARNDLLKMIGAGLALSLSAFGIQKLFFENAELFQHEYLGTPAFGHLSPATLVDRAAKFITHARFVALPIAGTVVLAVALRDARYLLGWAAELPWLVLNLTAAQELKSTFSIYTGFPFIGSLLWVGAYARVARAGPRNSGLGILVFVASLATIGFGWSHPRPLRFIIGSAFVPITEPYRNLARFSKSLAEDHETYGNILVDPGMASWAIEGIPAQRRIFDVRDIVSPDEADGVAFFRDGLLSPSIGRFLEKSPFSYCGRIRGSAVFLCVKDETKLPRYMRRSQPPY
jgi:hypothetical protein